MQSVCIYADGACSGNPGPGGWGAILTCENPPASKEISGSEHNTTNNRMELSAVLNALQCLHKPCKIKIVTDSRYIVDAFTKGWLTSWQKKGWVTASKTPVKNQDLWEELLEAIQPHQVEWQWIRGHNGHEYNERADQLAVEAREALVRR